ncbi:MAG: UDP-2,3-diacylglucosamine diphosphatase LpxI [Sporomusaceae bacterium]|nr:UDP-2,3-diacylglucosamine diphosphatase LpxI [Sporomusaceae bacterium]
MNTIGLLAGVGRLPVEFARAARGMGFAVLAITLVPGTDSELSAHCDKVVDIPVGQLDKIITTLEAEQVKQVTFLGKVTKEFLFSGQIPPDMRMIKLLQSLPDKNDDTLMLAFVKELAGAGIGVLDQTKLIQQLLPQPGVLTKLQPTEAQLADMKFGFSMAKAIGGLDIGQTVVVKDQAVLAVEAIEGTDAAILRGGALGRQGVIVAKAAKPQQDIRFDMPGIGVKTLQSMIEAKAAGLVIEAGKTLLVDKAAVLALAEEHHIVIVAM